MLEVAEIIEHLIDDEREGNDSPFMNQYSKTDDNGHVHFQLPHLRPDMTETDSATVILWDVKEGDIITPDDWLVMFDFMGIDWSLLVPPIGNSLRVVKIEASLGQTVHPHDPLIVFEILEPLKDKLSPNSAPLGGKKAE